jgi:hypothetical protein
VIAQYTVTLAGRSFIVLDSSKAAYACKKDKCDAARYAKEFSAMQPRPGSWLVTHRPVWGFRPHRKTINESLQQALAAWNGKLPDGITLDLAGHIHVAEVLSFSPTSARRSSCSAPAARCLRARSRATSPASRSAAPQ